MYFAWNSSLFYDEFIYKCFLCSLCSSNEICFNWTPVDSTLNLLCIVITQQFCQFHTFRTTISSYSHILELLLLLFRRTITNAALIANINAFQFTVETNSEYRLSRIMIYVCTRTTKINLLCENRTFLFTYVTISFFFPSEHPFF